MSINVAVPGGDAIALSAAMRALAPPVHGPSIAFLGHSVIANGVSISGNIIGNSALGHSTWTNILTRQRFYSPPSLNFGVAGDTIPMVAARVAAVIASGADICVVDAITNSVATTSDDVPTMTGQLKTLIFDPLIAAGITVIAIPMLGRSGAAVLTSGQRLRGMGVNNWLRSQSVVNRRNLYVADCGIAFDDPASAVWAERSGYTYTGGLHPNPTGAVAIANRVVSILNVLYPDWRAPVANPVDIYDAANIFGNRLANGSFAGGSTLATGWSLVTTAAGGATVATSKTTNSDGRNIQNLTVSDNYTGTNCATYINSSVNPADLVAGDILEAEFEFTIPAALTNIAYPYVELRTTEGGVTYQRQALTAQGVNPFGLGPISGVAKTAQRVLTATPSAASLQIGFFFITPQAGSAAVAGQISMMGASVRKVG